MTRCVFGEIGTTKTLRPSLMLASFLQFVSLASLKVLRMDEKIKVDRFWKDNYVVLPDTKGRTCPSPEEVYGEFKRDTGTLNITLEKFKVLLNSSLAFFMHCLPLLCIFLLGHNLCVSKRISIKQKTKKKSTKILQRFLKNGNRS